MLEENSEHLGHYAASGGRLLVNFLFYISYPSSGIKNTNQKCLTLEDATFNFYGDVGNKLPQLDA